jgi:PAS domain S-box-containing protein
VLLVVSALTLCAWGCGDPDYIQLIPSLPPLHYNGAFGFLLWGCAYLALARGRTRTVRALAGGLGTLGVLIIMSGVPGSGLRLDRWAFVPAQARAFPASGVPLGAGVTLCLAAAALVLATVRPTAVVTALISLSGAFFVVSGPVVLASSSASDVFGRPLAPSALGVGAAVLAGAALLTGAFRRGAPTFAFGHALPLGVGLIGLVVTLTLWAALNTEQERRINRQVQFETAHVQRLVQDGLAQELPRFAALSERWVGDDRERVKTAVSSWVGQTPACLGVARLDANGTVTWIESRQRHPETLAGFGGADELSDAARTGRTVVARPPRSHWQGTRVLLVFAPHQPNTGAGGLVCVLRIQDLFDLFVNANVAPGYAVTVTEGGETIFARYTIDQNHREPWSQSLPVPFQGRDWKLTVWPTQDALARESLSLPKLSLLIGLFTTALLALAVYLAQTARRRTAALENEAREREQAERALKQSEEKYRTLIENLEQGIFLQDREHRYVAANVPFCRGVGWTESAIVGATEADLYDEARAARHEEEVRTVLTEGRSVESEEEIITGERQAWVRRVLTPVRDSSGQITGVLGICWDVTEQRRLEAHVHQASKMDAIGQLAGGIAHDFNNLLTVILGNLELILSRCPDDAPDRALIMSAQGAAGRAAALTQRLLGFARRHQLDWRPTNLNTLATEVVAILQRTIDPLIRLETHLAPDLWTTHADPAQLNQVLMNLCLNARDAIDGPGHITIETACIGGGEARGSNGRSRGGEFVRLRVSDTGAGMAPEVKARMYEPFFTTKGVGKGTGLGLAMVFAIVRQHKGWIDCWSEVGTGTRFDVYLPRGESPKVAAPAPEPAVTARTGQGTVLVVDDEEMIRNLAALTLEGRGYRVLRAADGQQAVDIYSAEKDRIDLVLLDLTMPVLSGHEAFRHLLNLNPHVRVLFASGYAVEQLSDLEKELMAGFVKKPYRPNDLILAVETALREQPVPPDARTPTPWPPAVLAQRAVASVSGQCQ